MLAAIATIAAEAVSFTWFDIPRAISYLVAGINDEGLVAGTWIAADGSDVGFIRFPDGRISTPIVDANDNSGVTVVRAIHDEGVIAGFYGRPGSLHGLDLPGAAATFAQGINDEGRIVGRCAIADGVPHVFVSGDLAAASCL